MIQCSKWITLPPLLEDVAFAWAHFQRPKNSSVRTLLPKSPANTTTALACEWFRPDAEASGKMICPKTINVDGHCQNNPKNDQDWSTPTPEVSFTIRSFLKIYIYNYLYINLQKFETFWCSTSHQFPIISIWWGVRGGGNPSGERWSKEQVPSMSSPMPWS